MLSMQTNITQHIKKKKENVTHMETVTKVADDVGPPYDKVNLPQDFSISSNLQTST